MSLSYHLNVRKVIAKHPTCVEVGECRPPHQGGAKDTRHWCKGREGIPHTWEWHRSRDEREAEGRLGVAYNRITERPICFGCEKVDNRWRHYCRQCGEPWPHSTYVRGNMRPCRRCAAPWMVRVRPSSGAWKPTGSVVS